MSKAKLILILAFVVTLAAGVALGYTLAIRPAPRRSSRHNHLPDMKLTADQKAKMETIWNAAMRDLRETQSKQRQALQKEREAAVLAMLTEQQKAKYQEVLKDYTGKMAELGKARDKAYQEAAEKTKHILDPEQQAKFEEWLKGWREDRHPGAAPAGSKGPSPQQGRASSGATTPTQVEEHTAAGSGT